MIKIMVYERKQSLGPTWTKMIKQDMLLSLRIKTHDGGVDSGGAVKYRLSLLAWNHLGEVTIENQ